METYTLKVKDPDGKQRMFKICKDVPCQKFERGHWSVTITKVKRLDGLYIDKVEWEKR